MIKIGCANFVINARSYQMRFGLVEMTQMADKTPREKTVDKWRQEAPSSFEFVVCGGKTILEVSQRIRPIRSKLDLKVQKVKSATGIEALHQTLDRMERLKSKILHLQIPSYWLPLPDRMSEIRNCARLLPDQILVVWEPPRKWSDKMVENVSKTFNFIPVINPLDKKPISAYPIQYFKLGDKLKTRGNYSYTDSELKAVKKACQGPLTYVIFNNGPTSFKDALRFSKLTL